VKENHWFGNYVKISFPDGFVKVFDVVMLQAWSPYVRFDKPDPNAYYFIPWFEFWHRQPNIKKLVEKLIRQHIRYNRDKDIAYILMSDNYAALAIYQKFITIKHLKNASETADAITVDLDILGTTRTIIIFPVKHTNPEKGTRASIHIVQKT
jgi:hypothetical protein